MGLFDLTGHVALVTGGNSGIGLGMAEGLASCGARVCIWGTNEDRTKVALERLSEAGNEVAAMRVDVGDEEAVAAGVQSVVDRFGRLDSCFANAGVGAARQRLVDTSLEDFHRITRVNLDGTFVTLREAARHMIELGNGGSLVATSSLATVMGQSGGYAYAASKGGLVAIVKALAIELARHRIRANALLPGGVESNMTSATLADETFSRKVMPRMPLRRWGRGEDFAGIAAYLASPASEFHTGDAILIDGGYAIF
jgi:NAD(P)-dependent dehydrogenase (short-subunit alcohol dehydrogenase family)